jgi:hemolysin D
MCRTGRRPRKATYDTTISEAERDRLQQDLIATQLDGARLKASLSEADDPAADFVRLEGATPQQMDVQKAQLVNEVQEIRAKLKGLDRQIAQNQRNLAAVKATIEKLTKSIPTLEEKSKVR